MTVLIAEDNQMIVGLIRRLCERLSIQAQFCSNGKEAMDAFDPAIHYLVLTDKNMPEVSGTELAKHVKDISKVPVILMTGYPEPDMDRYVDKVLLKPFSLKDLTEAIQAFTV